MSGGRRLSSRPWHRLPAARAYQVPVERPCLVPGTLEMSNVSAAEEMVQMIDAMRSYEAAVRALQAHDESLGCAVSEVPRVG